MSKKSESPIVESAKQLAEADHKVKLTRQRYSNKKRALEEEEETLDEDEAAFAKAKQRHADNVRAMK